MILFFFVVILLWPVVIALIHRIASYRTENP